MPVISRETLCGVARVWHVHRHATGTTKVAKVTGESYPRREAVGPTLICGLGDERAGELLRWADDLGNLPGRLVPVTCMRWPHAPARVEANNAREPRTTRFFIILEQRSKRGVLPSVGRLGGVRIIHSRVTWFSAHKPGPILPVVIGAVTV